MIAVQSSCCSTYRVVHLTLCVRVHVCVCERGVGGVRVGGIMISVHCFSLGQSSAKKNSAFLHIFFTNFFGYKLIFFAWLNRKMLNAAVVKRSIS